MNIGLVLQVADAIEAHPKLYRQDAIGEGDLDPENECGAACCVGGWAIHLSGENLKSTWYRDILGEAARLLGLPGTPPVLASIWPQRWADRAGLDRKQLKIHTHRYVLNHFLPRPSEAVAILRGMAADGEWWD